MRKYLLTLLTQRDSIKINQEGVCNMAQTNINIRIDEDLKRDFDSLCQDLGLTMTTAFTVFAKTAVRRNEIPFKISKNIPNAETVEAIREVQAMKKDPSLGKAYTNVDDMMKELLA
jgi:DNA-damage-inducible protein J